MSSKSSVSSSEINSSKEIDKYENNEVLNEENDKIEEVIMEKIEKETREKIEKETREKIEKEEREKIKREEREKIEKQLKKEINEEEKKKIEIKVKEELKIKNGDTKKPYIKLDLVKEYLNVPENEEDPEYQEYIILLDKRKVIEARSVTYKKYGKIFGIIICALILLLAVIYFGSKLLNK